MTRKSIPGRADRWGSILLAVISLAVVATGCGKGRNTERYHRFQEHRWARFNLVSFEMPVDRPGEYDVLFYAAFNGDFEFGTLPFNMTMTTPSGEERINEYKMDVRDKAGDFCIECARDSCVGETWLKKRMFISREGILKIEIENLTPRLVTEGIAGVGIRIMPSGK